MSNKILMLISKSRYNALGSYSMQLGACFEKMGYEVDYVDGNKDGYEDHLYECTSNNEYFAIIACNAILTGYEKFIQKDSIFCCLMFDHPIHHHERLKIADCSTFVFHCDMKSAEYIAKYYPNVGGVGFLPLSGKYVDDIKQFGERQYDIVFTGSYNNSDEIYQTAKESYGKYFVYFKETTDILKENVGLTIQEAFEMVIQAKSILLSDDEFAEVLKDFRMIDNYMRAWIREKVVRIINDAGYKIHIFGGGWDKFESTYPENIIQMQGFGDEALKVLADAKIALNVMPWFRGGFQERIASAQLCGAIALTDTSTFIEEYFEDGEDILIYDALNPQSITDRIKKVLDNPEIGEKIANAGLKKAHEGHRWEQRAEEIIDNINEILYHR